jgi:nucleotide-binding universal stress UspA family protein
MNKYKVLLPIASPQEANILFPLCDAIVRDRHARVLVVYVIRVPEGKPLSVAASNAVQLREGLKPTLPHQLETAIQSKTMVRSDAEVWQGIWGLVESEKIDLLLLAWETDLLPVTAVGNIVNPRLANPPCDIVSVLWQEEHTGPVPWQDIKRILLPVRGGPHAGLALRVANTIAESSNATITLLHATRQAAHMAEQQVFNNFAPALHGLNRLKRSTTIVDNVPEAITEEAQNHQLLVMGAPSSQVHPDGWGGPLLDKIIAGTHIPLVIVKTKAEHNEATLQEITKTIAPQGQTIIDEGVSEAFYGDRPVAVVVDRWFAENTYHSREFMDLERLIEAKNNQGLSISLGLPALNEATTVGKVIQTIKTALMDEVPLLDEIVLIDSGSVDYTREIAADLGIPVYIHQEILPQYDSYHGKGEALWKSLYVLNGDIIAWVDTDIKNIHPRFIYGILGPLLQDSAIQYVKGFYRRPLREGEKILAGGGGRVTELTARPFINLFFPELSGIIQPLSGEYAGRRSALEKLPFFTGYGVETGLLLDLLDQYGLNAIAQVDLLERIHHNQPLPSLSKMSFAIMQVVFKRLEHIHSINLLHDSNLTMNLIRYNSRRYFLETEEIRERERPPMVSIPEYLEIHPPIDKHADTQTQISPQAQPE